MPKGIILTIGEWLLKLLPCIISYRKGRNDEKLKVLREQTAVIKKQNAIAALPDLERGAILKRMFKHEM